MKKEADNQYEEFQETLTTTTINKGVVSNG